MNEEDRNMGNHPRGTLAVVGLYGILMALGWLAVFFFIYLPRGIVTR